MIDLPAQSREKYKEKYGARSHVWLPLWTRAWPTILPLTCKGLAISKSNDPDSECILRYSHSGLSAAHYREQERVFMVAEKSPFESLELSFLGERCLF